MIPYGRQCIDEDDIEAVCDVLRSDWLTTGPAVDAFERAVADYVGVRHGVAVSSGTAALHAAMHALGIGPGDEVIVPAMTFVATANAVVFEGGTPVFADVLEGSLLVDPALVEARISQKTKAIVAVDFAGHPCDYDALTDIARRRGLPLVADACHALGAEYKGRRAGSLAEMTAFSFHPVKPITTAEGGMVTSDDSGLCRKLLRFRNHGIDTDFRQRADRGTFHYEMVDLGFNYRLSDLQCALGLSQLRKLPRWLVRRKHIARAYVQALAERGMPVTPLAEAPDIEHAHHLFVVQLPLSRWGERADVYARMRRAGVGVNVHYYPVYLHPFYRRRFGTGPGLCPVAEGVYERILSLPIYPAMQATDVARVVDALDEALAAVSARDRFTA